MELLACVRDAAFLTRSLSAQKGTSQIAKHGIMTSLYTMYNGHGREQRLFGRCVLWEHKEKEADELHRSSVFDVANKPQEAVRRSTMIPEKCSSFRVFMCISSR